MMIRCEKCNGSGFSGYGYDAVCDCAGGYIDGFKRCIILFGSSEHEKGIEIELLQQYTFYISAALALRNSGYDLFSDSIVNRIVMEDINKAKNFDDILLDDYPQTVTQAEYLRDALQADNIPVIVIHLYTGDPGEPFPALKVLEDAFGSYSVDASRDPVVVHKEVCKILGF